jgi:hypothetical protein
MTGKDFEPKDACKLYYKDALTELDKCLLLCHNCHSEKHFNIDRWNEHKNEILTKATQVPKKSTKRSVINPETIKKYHSEGYTVSKISKRTGYSIEAIYRVLEKLSLTPNIRVAKRNFTDEEFAKMKELRSQGYSYEKISELMSCSKQGVIYYKDRIN